MNKLERKIYNTAFIQFFVKKSRKIILPGFQGMPLYTVGKVFFNQVKKVGLQDRARSISFSFITAIPGGH